MRSAGAVGAHAHFSPFRACRLRPQTRSQTTRRQSLGVVAPSDRRARRLPGRRVSSPRVRGSANPTGLFAAGRHLGVGGDALREYLDWRPYRYFTNRFTPLGRGPHFFPGIETFEFIPTDAGTTVQYRFRLKDCGPLTRLRFLIIRPGGRTVLSLSRGTLRKILDEDAVTDASGPAPHAKRRSR